MHGISMNSLFRTYAKVRVRGRIHNNSQSHNREAIVCGERNGTPANKRKLCIVITTALTRTTNDVGERSCLGEYPTQSNCTGEDGHRDRSPNHISDYRSHPSSSLTRSHVRRVYKGVDRKTDRGSRMSTASQAHCWHFEDICYHLGGPHTCILGPPWAAGVGRWCRG